ncbi:zinc-binding alcohol dehydrogenase family protein [Streptomyces sp. NPDC087440]|uniref:quinone oxidoreductase family protein n=1 Tax=Streptomyces sp. NPDC087440 TaxID=3365790 RepID=UPI00380D2DBD
MLRIHHHVDPTALLPHRADVPRPGPGEILVHTEAVGVTLPSVRKVRESPVPVTLGGEVAGEVVEVGPGVEGFAVGERATGLCFVDAYAEFAVLRHDMASRIPARARAVDAVALVRSGTVARGAYEAGHVRPGESVLVTAAAGGVGSLALQLAAAGGAGRVVAAVGSAEKAAFVRELGADDVVLYEELREEGGSYDVILDGVGGELLGPCVRSLTMGGRLVAFSSGGGTVEAYELLLRGATMTGFQIRAVATGRPETYARWVRELWESWGAGGLRTVVHEEIPLAEAARAHAVVEQRRNLGKVVLVRTAPREPGCGRGPRGGQDESAGLGSFSSWQLGHGRYWLRRTPRGGPARESRRGIRE